VTRAATVTSTVLVADLPGIEAVVADGGLPVASATGRTAIVFASVEPALAAAARAAEAGAAVGLAVGELREGDGAWDGPARQVAEVLAERARQGSGAGSGHIVATAAVAALGALLPAGRAPSLGWTPAGPVHAGGAGVVDCVEAERAPGRLGAPTVVPLPPVLGLEPEFPFVGRAAAWDALVAAWEGAAAGARRLVLVGGDAGTGKTRLVTELSRWAHGRGAAVLYGACSEHSPLPYEPVAVALDLLVAGLGPDERSWLVRDRGEELARLVPRLAEGTPRPAGGREVAGGPDHRDGWSADPGARRFRLFGAVAATLATLASRQPVLLVLDDLHWARRPTLELLQHLLAGPGLERLCLVATYRSTPAEVGEDLKSALPDLRRQPGVSRVMLAGLDRDDVRRFVELAGGREARIDPEAAADELAGETGGNPFLLGELWRDVVAAGRVAGGTGPRSRSRSQRAARGSRPAGTPEGVREVVEARLARLPEGTRQVVRLAAVVGGSFRTQVVAEALGRPVAEVVDGLEPALGARIVEDTGPGAHRFVHALVRRAVVDGLPAAERRARHGDAARAFDRLDGDRSVAEVAYHLLEAVPLASAEDAVAAATRAAAVARRAVAYDDAARLLEGVLPLVPPGLRRGELLLEVADARMRAGDVTAAQARCVEATELGRALDDPGLIVAAALAFDDANWRAVLHGDAAETLLRAALPLATDPALGVRVRAALSRALALSGKGDEAEALARRTVEEARRLDGYEPRRVAHAAALFLPWTPLNLDRQLRTARDLLADARAQGDQEWELGALNKLLYGLVMAGDMDEARRALVQHGVLAAELGQPLFRVLDLFANGLVAMGEGRFAEAEAMAEEANALAEFLSGNDAGGGYGAQLFSIRRDQGRLDEARPLVEAVSRLGRSGATWRPALTVLQAELGLHEEARAGLSFLVAERLAAVPRDSLWSASLGYLADAAVVLGDEEAAAAIYGELVGFRGLVLQVGYLLAAHGAADRALGELCALMGRRRDAEAHFETALRVDRRSRMPVWLARTHLAYGRFLARRAAAGDRGRAAAMLRSAREAGLACGMPRLTAQAAGLLDEVTAARGGDAFGAVGPRGRVAAPYVGGPGLGGASSAVGSLTARELALLPLLAEGRTNREIGERLYISQHTAANHIRSILLKTGCTNRTEAAAWALRHGLAGQ
jgi:DNA-binding CsgD family transcriptional regulator/tetratricopeptide (TPR) repeat protein